MTDTGLLSSPAGSLVAPRPMMVANDAHITYKVYAGGKPVGARSKLLGHRGGNIDEVHAVRGVSFAANEGESIGVVGHNGSGKSTLFRAMAGLIPTSAGSIWAADRPVLLGVNAALMPELSGENNIKLGLLAMGFTAEEAAAQVDEIADFAELNEFISHPMRTYSSGMGARLRFAIASARPHSILLLDEALAVGDRRFRKKSEERIRDLRDAAGLVMIVSHSAGSLKDTCERALWIHKGELRADGPVKDVVDDYTRWTKNPNSVAVGAASTPKATVEAPQTPAASPRGTETRPVPLPVPHDSPRDRARRDRFLENARHKRRRKVVAGAITGGAIVAAVGAGAAIALVTSQADRSELTELRAVVSASPTPTPTPSVTPILPVIANFSAVTPTVLCETVEATVDAQIAWEVNSAARVLVTSLPTTENPAGIPILVDLPPSAPAQIVPFTCANETQTFTLVAENASGQQVSSAVTVTRELPPEPEIVEPEQPEIVEPEQPQPTAPEQPQPTEPTVPEPTPTEPQPTPTPTDPEPTPTTEPTTGPTTEPPTDPTEEPPAEGTTGDTP